MELKEGNLTHAHGIIFKKVGPDLPVVHGGFHTIPVQALAVSNKFGLTLLVHSSGFYVVSTADLVQASKDSIDSSKDESIVQKISLASVSLPDIRILALSKDELTVAACVENNVHFYRIPSLVQKGKAKIPTDTTPLRSILGPEENNAIKAFSWNPTKDDTFITLSSGGMLSTGHVSADSIVIAEEVEAADWSPDGQFVGYITRDRKLHTVGLDSSTSFSFSLPSEMFGETSDNGSAHVDMVRWVRLDSMLISCVHISADGEEDECSIFVLSSSEGHIAKDQKKTELFSFEQFFPSIDASILASGSGPYTLASQIPPWDVIVAASRRSIDDHISLLGWLQEDGKSEVYKFELADDRHIPRIELQASGDDNSVVGLAVDQTIASIQLPVPNGDSGEMLPAGPLLFCLTLEGTLSLFSLARTDPKWTNVDVLFPSVELPEEDAVPIPAVELPKEDAVPIPSVERPKEDASIPSVELPKEDAVPIPSVLDVAEGRQSDALQTSAEGQSVSSKVGVSSKESTGSLFSPTDALQICAEGQSVSPKVGVLSKESISSMSHSTSYNILSSLNESHGLERTFFPSADAMKPGALQTSAESQSDLSKVGVLTKESTSSMAHSHSQSIPSVKVGVSSKESTSIMAHSHSQSIPSVKVGVLSKESTSSMAHSASHSVPSLLNHLHGLQSSSFPLATVNKAAASQSFAETQSIPSKVVGSSIYNTNSMSNSPSSNLLSASNSLYGLESSVFQSADASKPGPLNKKKDADNFARPSGSMGFPQQRQVHGSCVSEMESDFVKELYKVRTMAKEIDELIAFTEGKASGRKGEQKKIFTKFMLEEIELGIEKLSKLCGGFQAKLEEQRQSVNDLRDESMQVDAWRIYVQSLFEQASDSRYQGLWHTHKLHPEMDAMRKRILKLDQSLKQQIAELEEHLHNLELSRWGRANNQSKHQSISILQNAEKIHHLQSLYNTVNAQMVVAEQLAHCLALQMETLKISFLSTKDEIEGLIGTSAEKLRDIDLEEQSLTKNSGSLSRLRERSCESGDFSPMRTRMNHVLQTPMKPDAIPGTNVGLQDSTRRRRDSVDRLWVDVGAAKTTVKRTGPIRHCEGTPISPNRGEMEKRVLQLRHLSGANAAQSILEPEQVSVSDAKSYIASSPSRRNEKMTVNTIQPEIGVPLVKPDVGPFLSKEGEQTSDSTDFSKAQSGIMKTKETHNKTTHLVSKTPTGIMSTKDTQHKTAHASAPTLKHSSGLSAPTSGSAMSTSTAVGFSSQPRNVSVSKAGILSSNLGVLTPQENTMFSMSVQTATNMDSISLPGVLSHSSSSKRSLMTGPQPWASSAAQPGMPRVGPRTKEDSGLVRAVSQSSTIQSMAPRDSEVKNIMSQMGDIFPSESTKIHKPKLQLDPSTSEKLEAQDTQSSQVFSSLLQETMVPTLPSEKPTTGTISGTSARTVTSPVIVSSSDSIDHATGLPSFTGVLQSLGTSSSSSVPVSTGSMGTFSSSSLPESTGSTGALFSSSVMSSTAASLQALPTSSGSLVPVSVRSVSAFSSSVINSSAATDQTISSQFEAMPFKAISSTTTGSVFGSGTSSAVSNVKATSFFGEEINAAPQQVFPQATSASASTSGFPFHGPPTTSDEEEMEEEASSAIESGFSGFAGFGLGPSATSAVSQKPSPFGNSAFGSQPTSAASFSLATGQLFKPAAFNLPTPQSPPLQNSGSTFGNAFSSGIGGGFGSGNSGFGSPAQPATAFGQPAQPGHGQQALGSALGTFGQTRQIGTPFGASVTGFGFPTSGGFASAAAGGGFASAASGGGFATAATGGGFANAASGGGGFAGFSSAGGFAGTSGGGGFQSFSGTQSGFGSFGGGPSGFGGNTNSGLFTQMRK